MNVRTVGDRELRLHLVLAGAYFGLNAVLLSLIPVRAGFLTTAPSTASLLLVFYTGVGILTDGAVGKAAQRYGTKVLILLGTGIAVVGVYRVLLAGGLISLAFGAATLGIASSFLATPILGGVAEHGGERQLKAQGINAIAQRGGALVAALFLGQIFAKGHDYRVDLALVLLLLALALPALLLKPANREFVPASRQKKNSGRAMIQTVASSRLLIAGLVANAAVPLLIIFGSSFFPLVLVQLVHADLLVPCLIGREVIAIGAAFVGGRLRTRERLSTYWVITCFVGAIGMVLVLVVDSPVWIVILFALHGTAIGLGIIVNNTRIYDGTTAENRMYGFAAGSIVSRVSSLLFPLAFGYALGLSLLWAIMVFAIILILLAAAYWRIGRGPGSPIDPTAAARPGGELPEQPHLKSTAGGGRAICAGSSKVRRARGCPVVGSYRLAAGATTLHRVIPIHPPL